LSEIHREGATSFLETTLEWGWTAQSHKLPGPWASVKSEARDKDRIRVEYRKLALFATLQFCAEQLTLPSDERTRGFRNMVEKYKKCSAKSLAIKVVDDWFSHLYPSMAVRPLAERLGDRSAATIVNDALNMKTMDRLQRLTAQHQAAAEAVMQFKAFLREWGPPPPPSNSFQFDPADLPSADALCTLMFSRK
jgi:hypothetical protein